MTTYVLKSGEEILVCDGCGKDHDGQTPDLADAKPYDFTAAMLSAGAPIGTKLAIKDYCPKCDTPERRRKQ